MSQVADTLRAGLARAVETTWQSGLHVLFRFIPVDLASDIGSLIATRYVRWSRPAIIAAARTNLRRHWPDAPPERIEQGVAAFLDNAGRLYAEFSLLHRLGADRIEIAGGEVIEAARAAGRPVVAITMHTGNIEVMLPALQSFGVEFATFYAPPRDEHKRRIVIKARERFGVRLLSPNVFGLREAVSRLQQGGVVAMAGDEARGGRLMGPLFGRPPHPDGNLALIAWLARRAQAQIVLSQCVRLRKSRFRVTFRGPYEMPPLPESGAADVLADVMFLNALVEPAVYAHVDQWYYMDDRM